MRRWLIYLLISLGISVGNGVVKAQDGDESKYRDRKESKVHYVRVKFETDGKRFSYGVGYEHGWHYSEYDEEGFGEGFMLGAVGAEINLLTKKHRKLNAVVLGGVGRFAAIFNGPGCSYETSIGVAISKKNIRGIMSVGAFIGFIYLDLGYVYQFPIFPFKRPYWMASHEFGTRGHIPVWEYDVRNTYAETPTEGESGENN
jgi:hypothetical protein